MSRLVCFLFLAACAVDSSEEDFVTSYEQVCSGPDSCDPEEEVVCGLEHPTEDEDCDFDPDAADACLNLLFDVCSAEGDIIIEGPPPCAMVYTCR